MTKTKLQKDVVPQSTSDELAQFRTRLERIQTSLRVETGVSRLQAIAAGLSEELRMSFCVVGQVIDRERMKVLHWCGPDDFRPRPTYSLSGTPQLNVLQERKLTICPDQAASLFPKAELLVQHRARAFIGVPIFGHEGQVIGVLSLFHPEPRHLDEEDQIVAELYAGYVAIELEHLDTEGQLAANLRQMEQRTNELAVLNTLSTEITAELDLERLLENLLSQATKLLDALWGALYLSRNMGKSLELCVNKFPDESLTGLVLNRGEGLAGKILESGQTEILTEQRNWPGRGPQFDRFNFRAMLGVPIKWGEEILGVLTMADSDPERTFNNRDVRLAELFARQAAIAIHNAHLYEQIRQQLQRQEVLYQTAVDLGSSLSIDRILETLTKRTAEALKVKTCTFNLLKDDSYQVVAEYNHPDLGEVSNLGRRFPLSDYPQEILAEGQPLHVYRSEGQHAASNPPLRLYLRYEQATCYLMMPVKIQDELIGMIEVFDDTPHRFFDREEIALLTILANQAAAAIKNAWLVEQLVKDERLLAIEQMTAAVHHEVNNPLTIIISNVDWLLKQAVEISEEDRQQLENIQQAAKRIRDLVAQLEHVKDYTITYVGQTTMIDLQRQQPKS